MTIIGTSTNLLVAGLVVYAAFQDNSIRGGIGFLEPGYIGERITSCVMGHVCSEEKS